MPQIEKKNSNQIAFRSLEDVIEKDNPVRFIDAFVEKLELEKTALCHENNESRSGFMNLLFNQTKGEK